MSNKEVIAMLLAGKLLGFHRVKDAKVTISVRPVPWEEAGRPLKEKRWASGA
ncbi:MAG: hypothetical protein ACOC5A_01280 [Halanaerobiales bacterium]